MADLEGGDSEFEVQRRVGDLGGVFCAVAHRKPRDYHVGITDSLHLVHAMLLNDLNKRPYILSTSYFFCSEMLM